MRKYCKKPGIVEAVQIGWDTWNDICDFVGDAISEHNPGRMVLGKQGEEIEFDLPTTHGDMATFRHGDWVLRDDKPGTFYPVKDNVFRNTYEAVDDA